MGSSSVIMLVLQFMNLLTDEVRGNSAGALEPLVVLGRQGHHPRVERSRALSGGLISVPQLSHYLIVFWR